MTIFQSLKDAILPLLLLLLPQARLLGHGRHHPKRVFTGKPHHLLSIARIFKLLRSRRIDSKEPIPPGCVAWRAGVTILFLHTQFLAPIGCLKNFNTGEMLIKWPLSKNLVTHNFYFCMTRNFGEIWRILISTHWNFTVILPMSFSGIKPNHDISPKF